MRTLTISEVPSGWNKLAEEAQHEPLQVVGEGIPDAIVISREHYERMRGAGRARLLASLQRLHKEVAASGLTDGEIEALIADDD